MGSEKRSAFRITFQDGYPARVFAVDGSWQRPCLVADISATGAKLEVEGALDGLHLEEFFLVLSDFGTAHRRCRKVWLQGGSMGVSFMKKANRPKRAQPHRMAAAP